MTADSFSSGRQSEKAATEHAASVSDDASRPTVDAPRTVPLWELLLSVPRDAVLNIDTPNALGCMDTHHIPVGRLCHEAAAAICGYIELFLNLPVFQPHGGKVAMSDASRFLSRIPKKDFADRLLAALKEFDSGARNHGMTWQRPFIAELDAAIDASRPYQPRGEEASTADALGSHAAEGTSASNGTDDKPNPNSVAPKGKEADQ